MWGTVGFSRKIQKITELSPIHLLLLFFQRFIGFPTCTWCLCHTVLFFVWGERHFEWSWKIETTLDISDIEWVLFSDRFLLFPTCTFDFSGHWSDMSEYTSAPVKRAARLFSHLKPSQRAARLFSLDKTKDSLSSSVSSAPVEYYPRTIFTDPKLACNKCNQVPVLFVSDAKGNLFCSSCSPVDFILCLFS